MLSRLIRQSHRIPLRSFSSSVTAISKPAGERSIKEHQSIVGADLLFNENKHSYVLSFPWNFQEVITQYESAYRPMSTSSFWHKFMVNSRAVVDFNNLFRDFH